MRKTNRNEIKENHEKQQNEKQIVVNRNELTRNKARQKQVLASNKNYPLHAITRHARLSGMTSLNSLRTLSASRYEEEEFNNTLFFP